MKEKRIDRSSLKNWTMAVLAVLLGLCAVGGMLSTVIAKYIKVVEKEGIIGSGDFDLSYQMRDPYLVDSMEELQEAIDYGYSYVKLFDLDSKTDTDSWVLTGAETLKLKQPLTIDLNGQTLVRNGTLSLLAIQPGATLTILDTSAEKTGGFYNPVGSVFSIDGGSMLIQGGKIESGPRYWEYYSYKDDSLTQSSRVDTTTTVIGSDDTAYPVIAYPKNGLGINGNIYFDVECGNIPADTYCYYICSDGSTSGDATIDPSTADFTYTYYVKADDHTYAGAEKAEGTIRVDIYGYKNDIAKAAGETDKPYSAVIMNSGALVVNAAPTKDYATLTDGAAAILPRDMTTGCFISYFGVDNTYGIYMKGGTMHVEDAGIFTTVNPKLIPNQSGLATAGRGICISTSSENKGLLQVDKGVYRSYNNRTINVTSGKITVNGGTFDMLSNFKEADTGRSAIYVHFKTEDDECKISNATFRIKSDTTTPLNVSQNTGTYKGGNSFAVYVEGGKLNLSNTKFSMYGSYVTGVYITGGSINMSSGSSMTFDGAEQTYGIYSLGGSVTEIGSDGFQFVGKDSTAISVQNGTVTAASVSSIEMKGENSVGIQVNKGTAAVLSHKFEFSGANSRAFKVVSEESTGVKSTLTIEDCTVNMKGANSAAIQMEGGELYIHKDEKHDVVTDAASIYLSGTNSAAIYSRGGTVLSDHIGYRLTGANSYGIFATAGHVNFHEGFINLTSPDECYGILGVSVDSKNPLMIDVLRSDIVVGGNYNHDGTTKQFLGWNDDATRTKVQTVANRNNTSGQISAYGASMGVFLANLVEGSDAHYCYLSLYGCNVYSVDVGLGLRSGDLFLSDGGLIETKNSSAIATTGGSIFVGRLNENYEYTATDGATKTLPLISQFTACNVTKKCVYIQNFDKLRNLTDIKESEKVGRDLRPEAIHSSGKTMTITSHLGEVGGNATKFNSSTNLSILNKEFTSPYPDKNDLHQVRHFNVYDCVYVNGGNISAEDVIEVTFTGMRNTLQSGPNDAYENGFAVHVLDGGFVMRQGTVTNAVGGGVAVAGGNVYLGKEGDENGTSKITISTTGDEVGIIKDAGASSTDTKTSDTYHFEIWHVLYAGNNYPDSWWIGQNKTGGTGLRVSEGNLTVYNADVTTNNGSAVGMLGKGNVTIHNGNFKGNIVEQKKTDGKVYSQGGPGSYYGLKMFAGGTVDIYGGTFKGANGGAYVMGEANSYTSGNVTITTRATVRIYTGKFEGLGGADAFTVGEGVNAYFGCYGSGKENFDYKSAISVQGKYTGIAVQAIDEGDVDANSKSNVHIYYGEYRGSSSDEYCDSIYNGSSTKAKGNVYVYSISGNTTTGNNRIRYWYNRKGHTGIYYRTTGNLWYSE